MKVSTKLYFGTVLQFVIAISLVFVVLQIQEKQNHDSAVINLAGRQRMLCQKMTKEILLFNQGACSAENILKTVDVFHQTLKALTYGGKAPLDLIQTQFTTLPVPETRTAVAQLQKVESLWGSFRDNVKRYLKERKASSLAYLKVHNLILLQEMNRAVFLMDKEAAGKVASLRKVLLWGSAGLCLLFLLTLFIVRQNVQIIFEELKQSYEKLQSLNRAKSRVIHHLSHELKTPLSVLGASLGLLKKRLSGKKDIGRGYEKILDRAQRNLDRLLEMQYQIGDILQKSDYKCHNLLSKLLDACADELEALVAQELGEEEILSRLRQQIDALFGPRTAVPQKIQLGELVAKKIEALRPKFAHSKCRVMTHISSTDPVWIPPEILDKVVEGLVRNAVENTPEGSCVEVAVIVGGEGPKLEVRDQGTGITEENQRMIFENIATVGDPMKYASRKPYEFNAGGRGFDLFRMRVFAERYDFSIKLVSQRCHFIPHDSNECPGNIQACPSYLNSETHQMDRGTTVTLQFQPAHGLADKKATPTSQIGPTKPISSPKELFHP
jgi:signal transduction histidine kinase